MTTYPKCLGDMFTEWLLVGGYFAGDVSQICKFSLYFPPITVWACFRASDSIYIYIFIYFYIYIYVYKYSTGPLQVKQETRHWPQSTVGTKSELDTFPPPEKKKQSHVTDRSTPPPKKKNNNTILPVKLAPVMSEVRYVEHVTHCTTIIYGTKTGPSHPIDFLRQWR